MTQIGLPEADPRGFGIEDGRRRVVIERVTPEINHGRFPIKRTVGDRVTVEADVFADGHDCLSSVLRHRKEGDAEWADERLEPLVDDRWRGEFVVPEIGRYHYTIQAWVNDFVSWQRGLAKKVDAAQDVSVEMLIGAPFVENAARRASLADALQLQRWARTLRAEDGASPAERIECALGHELGALMERYSDRRFAVTYERDLVVVVDRERARFSTWYEMFPRSSSSESGRHGTFRDCEKRLSYVAAMGFDVLYLPPIHPIGSTHRKGRDNSAVTEPGDPGSPWAIGSAEGGHKAVHPRLGTIDDFRRLVARARDLGIDIALDLAFQCSPDHPYVKEHPEWFGQRPDGTVQYAENPPKKYQDIYPLRFETDQWQSLWDELKSVVLFWIEQGVRIFRVDNPHTKPFRFWEWLIGEVKRAHPEVIFLAEAFTRPKVMRRLARLGFTQSYTYFAWRNTKEEIIEYFAELTRTEPREYFRPNLWPNTPDILPEYLQYGGRPAFMARLVLAATLGASYGVYGPAFELAESRPQALGREEYLHSEKYEIRQWDLEQRDSLKDFVARINQIRRANPALQTDRRLRFHRVDNDQIVAYSKQTEDGADTVLVVVNLDPHHTQSGWLDLSLDALDLDANQPYQAHDLLTDARFLWRGSKNYVELVPQVVPAHVFRLRYRVRSERDFEYYR